MVEAFSIALIIIVSRLILMRIVLALDSVIALALLTRLGLVPQAILLSFSSGDAKAFR